MWGCCYRMLWVAQRVHHLLRANHTVRTSPKILTLKARLLRAGHVVHRRLLLAAGAKIQPPWARPSG